MQKSALYFLLTGNTRLYRVIHQNDTILLKWTMMPNSDLKVLGEKVRKERKLAGLTQEQLAERCHVSTKHIANIEKGSMNPSYEILLAIARVLPVSLDALITPGMGKTEIELKEINRIYLSCPEAVRETLMDSTRTLAKHLTEFYSKIENPWKCFSCGTV